jgi:hypothetical protein
MTKCIRCGNSLQQLMCLALLEDAGAKVYPSSSYCSWGVEHDFSEIYHASDCAVHNMPAKPNGPCDCGAHK